MCIATAAALNKQFQNEPMKMCVTSGLAKSELLSEVVMYLVRVDGAICCTCHKLLSGHLLASDKLRIIFILRYVEYLTPSKFEYFRVLAGNSCISFCSSDTGSNGRT